MKLTLLVLLIVALLKNVVAAIAVSFNQGVKGKRSVGDNIRLHCSVTSLSDALVEEELLPAVQIKKKRRKLPVFIATNTTTVSATVAPVPIPVPIPSHIASVRSPVCGNSTSFTVHGEPVPLSRHMISRGRMYNPSATAQKAFAKACIDKLPKQPIDGPIKATMLFYFSRPKNHYGTGKNSHVLKSGVGYFHCKRKDLDNLIKFVLDALNGIAYLDDAQICMITSAKYYTDDPVGRIEVELTPLSEQ